MGSRDYGKSKPVSAWFAQRWSFRFDDRFLLAFLGLPKAVAPRLRGEEPVAEVLFNELNVDAYFLEYDDERSGDFAPLRFVPDNKVVVLGIISSKLPELESEASLITRIKEASQYLALDNMCLSSQCGFASTAHGNEISEATQWAKLELVVNTARTVWGDG